MTARLHILLGAGGVGKTTLAAGYALALARTPGRKVGLLGVDPSRRLAGALGVILDDVAAVVPSAGELRVAVIQPAESLRRWVGDAIDDPSARSRLVSNPFFLALADRLATATDVFAAARMVEWAESDPEMTDLVVDTAPGLNAIELLTRPERLTAFLGGRLVASLRLLARSASRPTASAGLLRDGAHRVLGGLARIGGVSLLFDLADFFSLVERVFARLVARTETARRWLRDETTEILVVAAATDAVTLTSVKLAEALTAARLPLRAMIVNRALPAQLGDAVGSFDGTAPIDARAARFLRYAAACFGLQARLVRSVRGRAATTLLVPDVRGLDVADRLDSLADLGDVLCRGLALVP